MQLTIDQSKRLARLQDDIQRGRLSYAAESLKALDVLLLLAHDPGVRALVADIARQPEVESPPIAEAPVVPTPAPPAVLSDPLRDVLSGPLRLHALLERDDALCLAWLGMPLAANGAGLTCLIAYASHWDRIEALWDVLAQRCKHNQRAATPDEATVVGECVHIHNLLWEGRQASTMQAAAGDGFDFGIHERGNAAGQAVRESWLSGLKNAAGQLRKKTLVYTV